MSTLKSKSTLRKATSYVTLLRDFTYVSCRASDKTCALSKLFYIAQTNVHKVDNRERCRQIRDGKKNLLAWTGLLQLDVHLCSQTSQTFDILGTETKTGPGPLLIGQFPAVSTPPCFFYVFVAAKSNIVSWLRSTSDFLKAEYKM